MNDQDIQTAIKGMNGFEVFLRSTVAAHLESDGMITIKTVKKRQGMQNNGYFPLVAFMNTKPALVKYVADLIFEITGYKRGFVYGSAAQGAQSRNPYRFELTRMATVERLLKQILPFLTIKKRLAELCLDLIHVKHLHRRGVNCPFSAAEMEKIEAINTDVKQWNQKGVATLYAFSS
jgi:hypothetical protein